MIEVKNKGRKIKVKTMCPKGLGQLICPDFKHSLYKKMDEEEDDETDEDDGDDEEGEDDDSDDF